MLRSGPSVAPLHVSPGEPQLPREFGLISAVREPVNRGNLQQRCSDRNLLGLIYNQPSLRDEKAGRAAGLEGPINIYLPCPRRFKRPPPFLLPGLSCNPSYSITLQGQRSFHPKSGSQALCFNVKLMRLRMRSCSSSSSRLNRHN